jgi:uncharacterized HhH-GPD family protein
MALYLSGNKQADALLSKDPFALLVGMVLDQQVPLEWAFAAPAELKRRLGGKLDAASIAATDPENLAGIFSERPALHRYPGSMARRVHELSRLLVDSYGGKAQNVWSGSKDGTELLGRLKQLPGFGDQKARIFLALLGKQLATRPEGWESAASPYGEPGSFRSVADIVDSASLDRVRATKQAAKLAAKTAADPPGKASSRPRTSASSKASANKSAAAPSGAAAKAARDRVAPDRPAAKKAAGRAPAKKAVELTSRQRGQAKRTAS